MKKYLPIAVFLIILLFFVYLGLFLSLRASTSHLDRLEADLVVVEDTQVQILKTIITPTPLATPSSTPIIKFRVSTSSSEVK